MAYTQLERDVNVYGLVSAFSHTFRADFRYAGERHEGWEFVFVESGRIIAEAEGKEYIIKSGELICHQPMEFHNFNPYHADATVTIFCFHCADEKMNFFANKILAVNQRQRMYLQDIVTQAEDFFEVSAPLQIAQEGSMHKRADATALQAQCLRNTIELLIASLYSAESTDIHSRMDAYSEHLKRKKLTEEIKRYLRNNLGASVRLATLAQTFSYSVSTIKTVFKADTGKSVMEYYNDLRLEAAKKMLSERTYSMREISELLGFNTPAHFSSFFKKSTGVSPKAYTAKA